MYLEVLVAYTFNLNNIGRIHLLCTPNVGPTRVICRISGINLSLYFHLFRYHAKIHLAQQARLGYHSPMLWIRSVSMMIVSLIVEMFQRSQELNNAMQSRGGEPVYWQENAVYSKRNWLGIACIVTFYVIYGGFSHDKMLF